MPQEHLKRWRKAVKQAHRELNCSKKTVAPKKGTELYRVARALYDSGVSFSKSRSKSRSRSRSRRLRSKY